MTQPSTERTASTDRTPPNERPGTFEALLAIVERLRDPDGCPWDRAQTHASLRQYLLEECYEAIEAIDSRDTSALAEELGDLLVHIAFHADIAKRSSEWTARELVFRTAEKLVRRHPHVFSDAPKLDTAAAVVGQWETLKRAERGPKRITESVPQALPALAQAAALQRKAEAAGIEWRGGDRNAINQERLDALRRASEGEEREAVAGDLLFEIAAEIRSAGVDPETALRSASFRFRRSLAALEQAAGDVPVADLPAPERTRLWSEAAGNHGPRERNIGNLTPSLAAETEALREAYAALNRNDIPAMVKAFDRKIEWTEPAEYPGGGTYHGHAVVKAHLSQSRGTWAEGGCDPERFIAAGDKVVVFVHVRVRLKHNMEWVEGRHAAVYTFRDGKAIQMRIFDDRRQALEWAGVKASDAN